MNLEEHRYLVAKALAPLQLPGPAVEWLLDMWDAFQGLDDWRDKTERPDSEIEHVIHTVLCKLPANSFFQVHALRLLPILSNVVLRWCGANQIEDNELEEHYPKSYMWRAGYYDLVLEVVHCAHGFDAARRASPFVASLYAETLEDYKKEFQHA
jgi:hypothetical protein